MRSRYPEVNKIFRSDELNKVLHESSRAKGSRYEAEASAYLERAGFRIIERNFHSKRGEIDIIAAEGDVLCFTEVKYRSGSGFGLPSEAVGSAKQRRIIYTARCYMLAKGIADVPVRFDVIEITGGRIRLIRDAFSA